MAIRSTNANRASKAYNPTARPAAGTGNFGRQNTDGPGGAPIDYGQRPPGSMSQKERWDRRVEDYGMSPWYASGDQMPWSGPPGQQRGQRTPFFTPDAGDPRNAGYWRESSTPEEQAAADAAAKQRFADEKAWLMQNPAYAAAWQQYQSVKGKGGRDETNAMKAVLSAQRAAKEARTKQNYMDRYGMSEDTYDNRFNTAWPVPKSPLGTSTHYPNGMPSPRPAAVGPTGAPPASTMALPPNANPMFEGYRGGAGVPQGPGGFGGYNPGASGARPFKPQPTPEQEAARRAALDTPMGGWDLNNWIAGQSKSGMGQSPMSGPAMSTGNPMGGGNYMDMNPNVAAGRAALGLGEYGRSPMGYGGYNPMMGGGGMGGMGFGGFGGFNPYSMLGGGMGMGYNPGAQFSPYMMM